MPELIELRLLNKKLAFELVPKCILKFKFEIPEEDDEDEKENMPPDLYKYVRNAYKLEISNY